MKQMAKKISQMTWAEVQQEMSIAGNPEKMTELGKEILTLIGQRMDPTNRAEMTNIEFMLDRVKAEVKTWQKIYDGKR